MKRILLLIVFFSTFLFNPPKILARSIDNNLTVQLTDQGFSPEHVEIKQGESLVFENIGQNDHWPASDIHPTHGIYPEFDPKKPIKPDKSWSFKFDKAGVWRMHDHLNPQFTGAITVKEDLKNNQPTANLRLQNFLEKIKQFLTNLFKRDIVPVEKDSTEIFSSDKKLYSYVKKFGPQQTTKRLSELVPQYGDCHQTAHKAGRFAYEVDGDKAFEQCGAECHSGCYHGATEAYFKVHGTANLTANLNVLCKSELNPFFSHQCVHGVGHGLMAWTNYQINEALKSCDLLQKRQDSCWTGVFMENIIGALSEKEAKAKGQADHVSSYLSEDPLYPCNMVDEKYRSSCYFLQTSRMIQLFGAEFKQIADTCLKVPQIYQEVCFESMGRDVGGVSRGNPTLSIEKCSFAPIGALRTGCLIGAVQDYFWDPSGQDDAIKFCQLLTKKDEKDACYRTIFARAPDVLTHKDDISAFCQKAEDPYKNTCVGLIR